MKYIYIIAFAFVLLASCEKEETQAEKDDKIIQQYITDNNLDATEHPSGLYYIINNTGSGGHPNYYSQVKVKYTGYETNGEVFDSNTIEYHLYKLIQGWQIGIPLIQKGGSAKLIIPSRLAYAGTSSPLANSVLIFDVSLIDFY